MSAFYSIRDLESLSGVKAHTIRIWEQRYGILHSERTATNIRIYNDHELKQIITIAVLNRKGLKISKLAKLNSEELQSMVLKLAQEPNEHESQIDSIILATIEYNENKIEKLLNNCILHLGFENTIFNVLFPLLEKIGILWITGSLNSAQEHFLSQIVRQKIIVAIDGIVGNETTNSKKFLLFLPQGEFHELNLLVLQYLLKSKGHKIYYFGASLQLKDLKTAVLQVIPDYIYTIITTATQNQSPEKYLQILTETFPDCQIVASGQGIHHKPTFPQKNLQILGSLEQVLHWINGTN